MYLKCALMQKINSHEWYDDIIFISAHAGRTCLFHITGLARPS